MDSCPSPLDEDEVVMLGSGEKFKIQEVNTSRVHSYQGLFKEQRHLFNSTRPQQQK